MNMDPTASQLAMAEQLIQHGQFDEARTQLKRLHKAQPKHTGVILQLALAERFLKHWPEAIALMRKAVALEPHNQLYREHLANMLLLSNEGRNMLQAVQLYGELLQVTPDHPVIATNLLILALRNDLPQAVLQSLPPLLALPLPPNLRLHYAAACAMAAYLVGDGAATAHYVAMALEHRAATLDADGKPVKNDLYFMLIYAEFLQDLLAFHAASPALYAPKNHQPVLHVIGESHCLAPAHLAIVRGTTSYRAVPHLIMGCKAYFLALEAANTWKYAFEEIVRKQPKDEPIVACFGEIDCRPTEGIMEHYRRDPHYAMQAGIESLCAGYVRFVKLAQLRRMAPTMILGVPAPNRIAMQDLQPGEEQVFTGMIRQFNAALEGEAAKQQLGFVDLYAQTVDAEGWAKDGVHIDHVHLKPSVVAEALTALG